MSGAPGRPVQRARELDELDPSLPVQVARPSQSWTSRNSRTSGSPSQRRASAGVRTTAGWGSPIARRVARIAASSKPARRSGARGGGRRRPAIDAAERRFDPARRGRRVVPDEDRRGALVDRPQPEVRQRAVQRPDHAQPISAARPPMAPPPSRAPRAARPSRGTRTRPAGRTGHGTGARRGTAASRVPSPVADPEPAVVRPRQGEGGRERLPPLRLRSVRMLLRERDGVADPAARRAEPVVVRRSASGPRRARSSRRRRPRRARRRRRRRTAGSRPSPANRRRSRRSGTISRSKWAEQPASGRSSSRRPRNSCPYCSANPSSWPWPIIGRPGRVASSVATPKYLSPVPNCSIAVFSSGFVMKFTNRPRIAGSNSSVSRITFR